MSSQLVFSVMTVPILKSKVRDPSPVPSNFRGLILQLVRMPLRSAPCPQQSGAWRHPAGGNLWRQLFTAATFCSKFWQYLEQTESDQGRSSRMDVMTDIHPVVRPPPEGLSATTSAQQGAGLRVEPLHEENGPLEGSVHGDAAFVAARRTIFAEADNRSGRQLGSMLGSESRLCFHPLPSACYDLLVFCLFCVRVL